MLYLGFLRKKGGGVLTGVYFYEHIFFPPVCS